VIDSKKPSRTSDLFTSFKRAPSDRRPVDLTLVADFIVAPQET